MGRAVFINYRGTDSHSYGALLYTELIRQFGEEHVFLDCESIPAGTEFVDELLRQVRSARVLLAVIGPRWLTTTNSSGGRRIDDPDDWIRRELGEAFVANVPVIPVLTEQVEIPSAAVLPADIAPLSRCQYRRLRYREPTTDLARIVSDLTSLDPALAVAARSRANTPRQLPAAPDQFTGRAIELGALTDAARWAPEVGATVAISAIGGAGGIGKTALALHWAYQHIHRFPDGQLYVNLRGFDPSGHPTPVGEAVRGFLDAFGTDPAKLPVELDAQTARYRSLVAGKRMLIVLDNAYDIDQVNPLLPGASTCTVLITSRRHLAGLATLNGARVLDLDVLPEPDAYALLARLLGSHRLTSEPQAVADLLAVCAGLPLAIRIVAARAEQHPAFLLTVLADELRDVSARLDALDAGDLHANLRAVLSWSVQALSPQATGLLRLLGIAPGPDISLSAAAALTALSARQVRVATRELEHASLVQQHVPDRYRAHDLIRLYAAESARQHVAEDVRTAALKRVLDFYLHTAHAADHHLDRHSTPLRLDPPQPGCHPQMLPTISAALAWLDNEHSCLLAAQHAANINGWHHYVWQLAWTLDTFHWRRAHIHDNIASWTTGLAAAEQLGDQAIRSRAHRRLGDGLILADRYAEALDHLRRSLAIAEHADDLGGQAHTHYVFTWAWQRLGDDQQALAHALHALQLFEAIDDPLGKAIALSATGWHHARLGNYDQALESCEQALTLARQHDDSDCEADTLKSLGFIAHHTGRNADAITLYRTELQIRQDIGDMYEEANALDHLAQAHALLGQHRDATHLWRRALHLVRQQHRTADADRIQQELDGITTNS